MNQPEPIGFVFHFTSVPALLAFRPACALADELNVRVDWCPLATVREPSRPASGHGDGASVAALHRRVRADYLAQDAARYARWHGVSLKRDAAGVDATLAHAGCLWANRFGVGRAYLARVWFAFWAGAFNIECQAEVARALAAAGAPGFDAADVSGLLAEHGERVAEQGVLQVPTFLVKGEPFVGRAHLPLIRALLREG